MKKYSISVVISFLLFFGSAFGQKPTPSPQINEDDTIVKISTALVQIDVTVTDRKGNLIKDLKPEEIEIYENQKRQTITNFTFIESENQSVQNLKNQDTNPKAGDISVPIPPVKLKPENIRRTIAFVVDDFSLESEGVYYTQKALKNFVDNQMREGDLISIIRTSSGVGALQQFTSDKRQLYAAIKNIRWSNIGKQALGNFSLFPSGSEETSPSDQNNLNSAEDEYAEYQQSVFTVGALGTTDFLINGMKRLPGRKSIMFISNSLSLKIQATRLPNEKVVKALKGLIESANRASIVIYTMTARGLSFGAGAFRADEAQSSINPEQCRRQSSVIRRQTE